MPQPSIRLWPLWKLLFRCNRNGKSACGELCIFVPAEDRLYPDSHYENGAAIVRAMQMQQPIDMHDPECIRRPSHRGIN